MFQQVKDRLKIEDVVERYGVRLNRLNKAICPFHKEKTASFSVNTSKQIFKCFSCSDKGGDLIEFTSKMFALTPYEACKKLNEDFNLNIGVKMTKFERMKAKKREKEVNKQKEEKRKRKEELEMLYEIFVKYDRVCIRNKPKRYEEPSSLWKFANEKREYYWEQILIKE